MNFFQLLNSWIINIRFGYWIRPKLVLYPGVKTYISRKAKITFADKGYLSVGKAWKGTNYSHSTFKVDSGGSLLVNGHFRFHTGIFISVNKGAFLELGSGYTNNDVEITCFNQISIGHGAAIAKGVIIRDSDNHVINGDKENVSRPIIIGENVWIGMRAVILKGVTIGDGAIIAAGAIVSRDIPPSCLAGGVPARVIKENVKWE